MKKHKIEVNTAQCIGCGLCKRDCPVNNIHIAGKKAVVNNQDCTKCGHCAAVCPKSAITIGGFSEAATEFETQTVLNPDQLLMAVKSGRSVRRFTAQEVSSDIIKQIIEAGRFTPTAQNLQNVSYIVIKDEIEKYEKMAFDILKRLLPFVRLFNRHAGNVVIDDHFFFKKAPLVILVVSGGRFGVVNGSLAASNMALMAQAQGLGLFYSGFFTIAVNSSAKLRKALEVKRKDKIVTALVLGHSDVVYHRTVLREPAEVIYK